MNGIGELGTASGRVIPSIPTMLHWAHQEAIVNGKRASKTAERMFFGGVSGGDDPSGRDGLNRNAARFRS